MAKTSRQTAPNHNPRTAAVRILLELDKKAQPVKPVFDRFTTTFSDHTQRAFTTTLVYGVLRQRQTLLRMIEILSRPPLDKIDPFICKTLSVALFQLFFLDKIPPSAAVNEAVKGCKKARMPKHLHGFVNGVLRQAIRQREDLERRARTFSDNSPVLNHPSWLLQRWQDSYGLKQTQRICTINNSRPPLALRVNRSKIERDELCRIFDKKGIAARPGHYSEDSLVLLNYSGSPTGLFGYQEGLFQIQDQAAQLATSLMLPLADHGHYLDACAGLGGKTFALLDHAASLTCHIAAIEPAAARRKLLLQNKKRLAPNHPGITFSVAGESLQDFCKKTDLAFDKILVDAPCSGTGVLRRQPDIRWNRREKDIEDFQRQQRELLAEAAHLLRPGGSLVYATCSLLPEENEDVVHHFLANNPHFQLQDAALHLPATARELVRGQFFNPLPAPEIDGFFAALLKRK